MASGNHQNIWCPFLNQQKTTRPLEQLPGFLVMVKNHLEYLWYGFERNQSEDSGALNLYRNCAAIKEYLTYGGLVGSLSVNCQQLSGSKNSGHGGHGQAKE